MLKIVLLSTINFVVVSVTAQRGEKYQTGEIRLTDKFFIMLVA